MRASGCSRLRHVMGALLVPLACWLASTVQAQTPPPAQERAAAIKQAIAQNQAELRKYTWVETTDVSLKGEVKKHEQKQCSYGADGKVQKTALPGAAPEAPKKEPASSGRRGGGRLKENIVENKIEDMKEYLAKVSALVHEYVPPDPQKIKAAEAAGNLTVEPSGGVTMLTAKNYVKSGDTLTLGLDTASKKLSRYQVGSYVEKPKDDDVTLTVTFATLPDGTSYPEKIVLVVKAKNIQVNITNSGYKKAGA